jgi:hypothetical protein
MRALKGCHVSWGLESGWTDVKMLTPPALSVPRSLIGNLRVDARWVQGHQRLRSVGLYAKGVGRPETKDCQWTVSAMPLAKCQKCNNNHVAVCRGHLHLQYADSSDEVEYYGRFHLLCHPPEFLDQDKEAAPNSK